jgi:DNA topoisomerase-1
MIKSTFFNFLDSMRYFATVSVHPQVYKNLNLFCQNKKPTDELFDKVSVG